jgi:hypothetical protein
MVVRFKNQDHRGRWKGDPDDFHIVKVVNRFRDQRRTKKEVVSLLESLGFELYWIKKSKNRWGHIIWTAKTKNNIYGQGTIEYCSQPITARLNWITFDEPRVDFWHRTKLDQRCRQVFGICLEENTLEPYTY